ncbi:hypothetical protein GCM10027167_17900 [Nocardia heshunensis]
MIGHPGPESAQQATGHRRMRGGIGDADCGTSHLTSFRYPLEYLKAIPPGVSEAMWNTSRQPSGIPVNPRYGHAIGVAAPPPD